ncbi:cytochrome p450 [Moniliophthora roreri MCA 2997]|uniref:Cytochrome p450 n=1 Tax=Moniliophthora roreri (strain MCA 2997) TaxID=1381753 RepID=V2XA99_MONRO|nr:cytochrome p450 [Moniliophthora roreri MCA 2997]
MEALSTKQIGPLVVSFVILYIIQKVIGFRRAVNSVGGLPGYRTIMCQRTFLANSLPPITGLTPGKNHTFIGKFKIYEGFGWDIISNVAAFPCDATLNVANAAAIKEITSSRARFPKPVEMYASLLFFGKNIIASEGELWKKYRKIASPAFSDRNNKLVWDETVRIMLDLFKNVWGSQEAITIDHVVDVTLPIALFVISVAGFGRRISWQDDIGVPAGHQMTFKEALHEVSTGIFIKLAVSKWAMGLNEYFRKIRLAFAELDRYMLEMIANRRNAEKKEERYDLFSSLLDANDDTTSGEPPLTERELIGNIFIFLLAGHETTAHTLAFTFGMLAIHQDEQEALYQHIRSIIPDGRIPTYEEMPLLTQSMAVFYETLRMFPPVNAIPKVSAEDTTLMSESPSTGESRVIPIPRGTYIHINIVGLHYNPRYWKDPEEFKPSRFREDWPRDAFLPFSGGARACIGRKFFETEGIVILTMLVSQYKIELKDEPEFANETLEEKKARIFASKPGVTLAPIRMPLVFKRR